MKGFIYRRAVALKEFGERIRLDFIRDTGIAIRDWVLEHTNVEEFMIANCPGGK